jgi:hypothetical protein
MLVVRLHYMNARCHCHGDLNCSFLIEICLFYTFFFESARENLRCGDLSITVKTEANHDASHSNVGIVIKVVGQVTNRAQDSVPGGGGKAQRSEAFDCGRGSMYTEKVLRNIQRRH